MSQPNDNPLVIRRQSYAKTDVDSKTSVNSKKSSTLNNCRICLSTMLDPAALTCGHRFCEKCLHEYWRVGDKPERIVCPLCRASAVNVDFAKKEEISSTEDFRKSFNSVDNINYVRQSEINKAMLCFKMSILIPIVYYMLKCLGLPVVQFFKLLQYKLGH